MTAIEIHPFPNGFGAELKGLDLARPLTEDVFRQWQAALDAHSVLAIRDQEFTDAQHVAFSERFGPLEEYVDPVRRFGGPRKSWRPLSCKRNDPGSNSQSIRESCRIASRLRTH